MLKCSVCMVIGLAMSVKRSVCLGLVFGWTPVCYSLVVLSLWTLLIVRYSEQHAMQDCSVAED
jgi:hypothetical protein